MTREEKKRLLAEIEKQYKWLMTKSPTIYMMDIAFDAIRKAVRDEAEQEPKISLDTYKQVTKERDIAIEQLHELGYEFGEKIEPTTKNDLGVDCISRQALYDALYERFHEEDNNITNVTLGSVRNFVKDFPSITPQEPFINKSCISTGVCEHDKQEVLDKIRAEIADLADADAYGDYQQGFSFGLMMAVQIIDKYKAESEDE